MLFRVGWGAALRCVSVWPLRQSFFSARKKTNTKIDTAGNICHRTASHHDVCASHAGLVGEETEQKTDNVRHLAFRIWAWPTGMACSLAFPGTWECRG